MHPSRFTFLAFLSWLHTLAPDKVVGNINHSRLCPLANFLLDVTGRASLVRTQTYQSPSWSEVYDLPQWAAWFARELDFRYIVDENGTPRLLNSVTVQQCIEVLSTVHQWETGYVMLCPRRHTPVLPFSSSLSPCTPNATRHTPYVVRPAVPLGSVLFAPISTPVAPGLASDDFLSTAWLAEVA